MQIILLEKISKLGDIGSIVTVKGGFGRNYLIPRQKAIRATKSNIELFEKQKEQIAQESAAKKLLAEELLENLKEISITLARQAAEDGRLFGSVSSKDIANAISEKLGKNFSSSMVILNTKFKEIGVYQIELLLHPEVTASMQLTIVRTTDNSKTGSVMTDEVEEIN